MKHRGRGACLIVAAVLLLLAVIPAWLWLALRADFTEQTAAERWQGSNEARFCQVSCFLDGSIGLTADMEYSIRQSLENGLAGESEERWILALSGFTGVTVSTDSTSVSARGIYTAGSYSFFHPVQMLSGSWYDPQEVNRDGVVLDMELAWRLFGGYELRGMSIKVNGIPVQISGVARPPESGIEQSVCGQTPTIWLSADLLERLGISPALTCVEAVLPDPVTHFAEQQLGNAVGGSTESCELVENTGRFAFLRSLELFFHPDERVMRTSRVTYPYWENAARVAESRCGIYAALMLLLLLFPAAVCIYWVFRGLGLLRSTFRRIIKKR